MRPLNPESFSVKVNDELVTESSDSLSSDDIPYLWIISSIIITIIAMYGLKLMK